MVVSPLAQYDITELKESEGITEAGKHLVLKLKLNDEMQIENIQDLQLYFNNERITNTQNITSDLKENIVVKFSVPLHTTATIYGWKSLRKMYNDYFAINEEDIGKRIKDPHILEIKFKYGAKEYIETIKLDTIDDYVTNMNYRFDNDFINKKETLELEKWIEI